MTLTEKHRSSIYRTLSPLLGEEEAEALLGQFPAGESDELVTKQFLRAELAEFRADFRLEMHRELRQLTIWLVGVVLAGVGTNAAIAVALAH